MPRLRSGCPALQARTAGFTWGEVNLFAEHPHLKDFRLTLDYPEDYTFLSKLYADLVQRYGRAFNLADLIARLETREYQQELGWMRDLDAHWAQHFANTSSPVDADVARIKAMKASGYAG